MNSRRRSLFVFLAAGASLTNACLGAGYDVPDQSGRGMGMADAFIAGATGASAAYYNPAGLADVQTLEFNGNLYLAHTEIEAEIDGGGTEESDNDVYLSPNLFYAHRLSAHPNVVAGIGIYAPYGQGLNWDEDDAPKTTAVFRSGRITFVNVNPSLAWGVNDAVSLGIGLDAAWSKAEVETGPVAGGLEGDGDSTALGWNAGMQVRMTPQWKLGLTYRSRLEMEYEGDIPAALGDSIEMDYPRSAGAGLEYRRIPAVRLEVSAIWKEWSSVKSIRPGGDRWEDNWTFMVGGEYDVAPRWTLRAGYGLSQQPKPDTELTLNKDDSHAFAAGFSRRFGERWTLDGAALLALGEEKHVDRSGLPPAFAYEADYSSVGYSLAAGLRYAF